MKTFPDEIVPASGAGAAAAVLRVLVAQTFVAKARGLIGRPLPARGSGLLLKEVAAVHSFGMRQPLDLVFLDPEGVIVQCARLAPLRIKACRYACDVLELRAGEIERMGLREGARPLLVPVDDIFTEFLATSSGALAASARPGAARAGCGSDSRLLAFVLTTLLVGLPEYGAAQRPGPPSGLVTGTPGVLAPIGLAQPLSAHTLQALEDEAELLYRDDRHRSRGDTEAIRIYESLAELDHGRSSHAWLRIGNIHQRSGAVGKAIDAYRRVLGTGSGPASAANAAATSAERKALLNLANLALDQARQSLARLASIPALAGVGASREEDDRALVPQGEASASGTVAAYDRQLQSLGHSLARHQASERQLLAAETPASLGQSPPYLVDRYTASARRNAVKTAKGSLHVDPADELPARPVAKRPARATVDQLPKVEYLLGDPNRLQQEAGKRAVGTRAVGTRGDSR